MNGHSKDPTNPHIVSGDMSQQGHVSGGDTTAHRSSVLTGGTVGSLAILVFSGDPERPPRAHWVDRPLTAGRAEDSDVPLGDAAASRHHLRLSPGRDGIVEVEDLGSRNGTYLNGTPILRAEARADSLLRAGDTLLRVAWLTEAFQPPTSDGPLVAGNAAATIRRLVALVGPTALPVLILGETGTGKEVVARLVHAASNRRGPFIAVNCAALPAALVESELFGHVRGAFTDAAQARKGLFAAATGGTLFLDEVGDLPLAAQAKLLRVLEDGLVRPVGSETPQKVDVRVLSATNRDLREAVQEKAFRADLLARLGAVEAHTPSLRSRPEDLPALVSYLRRRSSAGPPLSIHADALEAMALYDWPQNVRELDNLVRQAALQNATTLAFAQLPERIQRALRAKRGGESPAGLPRPEDPRAELVHALKLHRGNVRRASSTLRLARSHVYRLLKRWSLNPDDFRDGTPVAGGGESQLE
jgi:transcriptional regulator of acetoin/glycerol metabolism